MRAHAIVTLSLIAIVTGCRGVIVPGAGSILSPRVSEAQEIRAGQRAAREVTRAVGLVADQELQEYVQQVGDQLAELSDRSDLEWTFRVVDDPMPNAFALPGGFVFVTRGLLGVLDSEGELATILAHQIAHVSARHGVEAMGRTSGPELGVWAVPVTEIRSLDAGSTAGAGLLFLPHSLEDERRADDLAFRYMLGAGYDVREVPKVLAALARLDIVGARSALPSWHTTHPDPGQRIEVAGRRLEGVTEPADSLRQNRVPFLDQIEDIVYGEDPRQGYFRGSLFVHPELRFQLQLPAEWRTRQLAQTVVAVSPTRDAVVQLTLSDQSTPVEAAQQFARQTGVTAVGPTTTDTLRGNPVAGLPFRVATASGAATGHAQWILHGTRVYQIVGVVVSGAAGHDATIRAVLGSFAPVTDARLLDARPNRINIVRLGRATTFEDFSRRYPSTVDAEEVALLNRVSGPGARLRAGGRIKRVVKG